MTRPGYENKGLESILTKEFAARFVYDKEIAGFKGPTGHTIYFRHTTFLDISSSRMRTMAQTGNSLRYLTPDNVRNYIIKNSLYRKE